MMKSSVRWIVYLLQVSTSYIHTQIIIVCVCGSGGGGVVVEAELEVFVLYSVGL